MTWQIIYFIIALLCIRQAYNFYKSVDGNLRKASIWLYCTVAFAFTFRALGEYLSFSHAVIGYISGTPVLFAIVYLTFIVEIEIKIHANKPKK